ncbi:hypothetical protein VFC49_06370 [Thermococcus sp. SY098]|uniref:hypothetical protein n=1 Tax=Thermococcus sp. SY098 TaxID=3111325 RepID=UPI002D7924DD|nr:hypothetical protein [Thermococcus sp. SY098]WRS51723.1 hypothetical protein VFC49_06370 [Thermococcus sp. SY098]
MEKSDDILSLYLDMLSSGFYIGNVRGSITAVTEEGEFPLISPVSTTTFDIFCSENSLILFGFWKHGEEAEYGYLKIPLSRIEMIGEIDDELILYVFSEKRTQDSIGFVRLNLYPEPIIKEKLLKVIEFEGK